MSTMNPPHAQSSIIIMCALVLLFTPSFLLAQDPYDEIQKLQGRIADLGAQIEASQRRLLETGTRNARQADAFEILNSTLTRLDSVNREFTVLSQLKFLASLMTEKLAIQYAMRTVEGQRTYFKAITKGSIELSEKYLSYPNDRETTRLLLEARELFRSSAELLDRLQIPAP